MGRHMKNKEQTLEGLIGALNKEICPMENPHVCQNKKLINKFHTKLKKHFFIISKDLARGKAVDVVEWKPEFYWNNIKRMWTDPKKLTPAKGPFKALKLKDLGGKG